MCGFTFHMQGPLLITWTLNLSTHCHLWHNFWISDSCLNKIKQMKGLKDFNTRNNLQENRDLMLGRLSWSESHENHSL